MINGNTITVILDEKSFATKKFQVQNQKRRKSFVKVVSLD